MENQGTPVDLNSEAKKHVNEIYESITVWEIMADQFLTEQINNSNDDDKLDLIKYQSRWRERIHNSLEAYMNAADDNKKRKALENYYRLCKEVLGELHELPESKQTPNNRGDER